MKQFDSDYLGITLILSLLIHGIIIFGIHLNAPENIAGKSITLDIILTQSPPSNKQPTKADFQSNTHQIGHGNSSKKQPLIKKTVHHKKILPILASKAQDKNNSIMSNANATIKIYKNKQPTRQNTKATRPSPQQQLIIAQESDKEQALRVFAFNPRESTISASTQESRFANYLDAWRTKIVHYGKVNFPAQIKANKISGRVKLDVALNSDGTLNKILIIKSSGLAVLDNGAIELVTHAAPFAPFPENIRQDTDILHIIRYITFSHGTN